MTPYLKAQDEINLERIAQTRMAKVLDIMITKEAEVYAKEHDVDEDEVERFLNDWLAEYLS